MRVALVVALTLTLSTGSVHTVDDAPGNPRSGQILADPVPPHRVLSGPSDAAHADPFRPTVSSRMTTRSPVGRKDSVSEFLACVIRHESGGNPKAENPTSTASGLYQFIDASWRSYSRLAGHPGWSHAADAPASVQTAVARWVVINKGRYPWKGTRCGGGT